MNLHENIRRLRKAAGITATEAAERGGFHQTTWSDIERGKNRNPTPRTLEKIARALDVTLAELFVDEGGESVTLETRAGMQAIEFEVAGGSQYVVRERELLDPRQPNNWDVYEVAVRFDVRRSDERQWVVDVVAVRLKDQIFMPGWRVEYPPEGSAMTQGLPVYGGAVGVIEHLAEADRFDDLPRHACVLVSGDGRLSLVGADRNERTPIRDAHGYPLRVEIRPPDGVSPVAQAPSPGTEA